VINEYNIARKFSCFIGDNASSNDSELIQALNGHPELDVNAKYWIRCAGYIINLVVKATIYSKGVSKFKEEIA
jgi:hypothetical protein